MYLEDFRILLVGVISAIISFFSPIHDYVFALAIIFFLNFFAGLLDDILVTGIGFKFKKFKHCIIEVAVYFLLLAGIYSVGEFTYNQSGAVQCISAVMLVIIYYYSVNILRNLKSMLPDSKPIAFLYYVLSFEILKKYPILKKFEEKEKDENTKQL